MLKFEQFIKDQKLSDRERIKMESTINLYTEPENIQFNDTNQRKEDGTGEMVAVQEQPEEEEEKKEEEDDPV